MGIPDIVIVRLPICALRERGQLPIFADWQQRENWRLSGFELNIGYTKVI